MKPKENMTEPLIRGAVSLPLPNNQKNKMIFGGSDDDVEVCLNCTLPANKCRGLKRCYSYQKKKNGGENKL